MKISLFLVLLLLLPMNFTAVNTSHAQCGGIYTSCHICHDIRKEMPVNYKDPWHRDHSFGHICDFCHGGNIHSIIKEDSHKNMVPDPMRFNKQICEPCHKDFKERAEKYEPILKKKKEEKKKLEEKEKQEKDNELKKEDKLE